MTYRHSLILAGALALSASAATGQQAADKLSPAAQVHADAVKSASDYVAAHCEQVLPANLRGKRMTLDQSRDLGTIPGQLQRPAKVFDNLYFVGARNVSAWAITTSAGIILVDTLNNADEAEKGIEADFHTLGLDPTQIKYVIITHAHGDHFGGAKYIQDKFHPKLFMSDTDWKGLASAKLKPGQAIPKRDQTVTDGEKLTLGDETLTLYVTPGHTPGTVSLLIPVKDHGTPHLAALLGGSSPRVNADYAQSTARFRDIAVAAHADTPLSNHSDVDRVHLKIAALKTRGPGDPHPYVTGTECVRQLLVRRGENAAVKAAQEAK